jgi:hypothetical protein
MFQKLVCSPIIYIGFFVKLLFKEGHHEFGQLFLFSFLAVQSKKEYGCSLPTPFPTTTKAISLTMESKFSSEYL